MAGNSNYHLKCEWYDLNVCPERGCRGEGIVRCLKQRSSWVRKGSKRTPVPIESYCMSKRVSSKIR